MIVPIVPIVLLHNLTKPIFLDYKQNDSAC